MCNLASLALPTFIVDGKYDFQKLHDVCKVVAFNLNRIIDVNYYPIPEARRSNMRHRPIGLGVQGLADTFMALHMPFDSPEAKALNIQIFETMYHGALEASVEMAERDGPYETWMGSPAQKGQLQYDLWGITPTDLWDWASLKEKIAKSGLRNSLLMAPMPTASTSQILGFNECFEPYTRFVLSSKLYLDKFTNPLQQQHLHSSCSRRRVPGRLPMASARACRSWSLGRQHEEHDHRPQWLYPEHS